MSHHLWWKRRPSAKLPSGVFDDAVVITTSLLEMALHHHHVCDHQSRHHHIHQVIAELMDRHGGYQRPEVADVLWVQVPKTIIITAIMVSDPYDFLSANTKFALTLKNWVAPLHLLLIHECAFRHHQTSALFFELGTRPKCSLTILWDILIVLFWSQRAEWSPTETELSSSSQVPQLTGLENLTNRHNNQGCQSLQCCNPLHCNALQGARHYSSP